jgi:hypothetical protein
MMELVDYCRAHGIVIDFPPPIGYWKRYHTVDHPKKRNGAVKFMGDHAFVQNHATDTEVSIWKPDSISEGARRDYAQLVQKAEQDKIRMQEKAAIKAKDLLNGSLLGIRTKTPMELLTTNHMTYLLLTATATETWCGQNNLDPIQMITHHP